MKRQLLALLVLVVVSMPLAECGLFSPSDRTPAPPPPPDQSKYETLPAKHYLPDADGNPTHMWVVFSSVSPLRGFQVIFGHDNNCANCFRMQITVGTDPLPSPHITTQFTAGFSQDGSNIITRLWGSSVRGTKTASTDSDQVWVFNERPKYIVVTGYHSGDNISPTPNQFPEESGTTNFLLDYK